MSSRREPKRTSATDQERIARVSAPMPQLQLSDFNLPNAAAGFVLPALIRAFVENVSALRACVEVGGALVAQADAKAHEAEVMQVVQDALQLAQNLKALAGWIYPRKVVPVEEALRKAEAFRELGDDWVGSMCSALQTFPEGAPPRMRRSHIDAFEFMLQSQKNTLGMAVPKFCTCGGEHTARCRERLKTGVRGLKKILRKHAPDLVFQYESLHPNRDKKAD
jgi:hypothetical protein